MKFTDRTTSDQLVLLIAGTICSCVLVGAIALVVATFVQEGDHPGAVALVSDTIGMLTSLLAGFIAGRTESNYVRTERAPDGPA